MGKQQQQEQQQVPDDLNADERARTALRMKVYDFTWEEIAAKVGYPSPDAARMAANRLKARIKRRQERDHRYYIGEALSDMKRILYPGIQSGDLWSFDRMLKLIEQERALYGVDMPTENDRNATPYNKRITIHHAEPTEPGEAA